MKVLLKTEYVEIPENTTASFSGKKLLATGAVSSISKDLSHFNITMDIFEEKIRLRLWNANRTEQAKLRTCASIIRNALNGCTFGFTYILKVAYRHFPIATEVVDSGKTVLIKGFLGEKSIRRFEVLGDAKAKIGKDKDTFVIEGSSIDDVSQTAGNIIDNCKERRLDRRLFLDGIYVQKKGLSTIFAE